MLFLSKRSSNNTLEMKNFLLRNPALALVAVALVLVMPFMASVANAQLSNTPAPQTNITTVDSVYILIDDIFNILFWLLIVLATIFIIWAAFGYLTAGGDPEKVKKANHRIIYAVVAVVVAVLARAIPTVICSFIAEGGCEIDTSSR